jgi:hypothetical protein
MSKHHRERVRRREEEAREAVRTDFRIASALDFIYAASDELERCQTRELLGIYKGKLHGKNSFNAAGARTQQLDRAVDPRSPEAR